MSWPSAWRPPCWPLPSIRPLGAFGACFALLIANLVRATGAVIAIAWLIAKEHARLPANPIGDFRQPRSDREGPRRVRGTEEPV